MARLLLPLLLLYTANTVTALPQHHTTAASAQHHTAEASSQPQACAARRQPLPATQASWCSDAPCNTTEDVVTLSLPVLLSLEDPRSEKNAESAWGVLLQLLDSTGAGRSVVQVTWNETQREVVPRSKVCRGVSMVSTDTFPAALQPEEHWLHLLLEAAGRQVTLSHLKATGKMPAVILIFHDDPPSMVEIQPRTTLGYSAITAGKTTTTSAPVTTIATSISNNNLCLVLLALITVLVVISVVGSVVMLVQVLSVWRVVRTLNDVLLGARGEADQQRQRQDEPKAEA